MSSKLSNILDSVHAELDIRVWDAADTVDPKLKPDHKTFIVHTIQSTLERHGYQDSDKWLSLVLTGSLTTYQYSDQSDCDISLWVDTQAFPEWSRAEMIGIMISECDGKTLPGTPHPLQCFVVASTRFRKEDLYKPGVRSGYDISTDKWIVPPDKSRVHDVEREEVEAYAIALENADKMEKLIRYEPQKAVMFYDQLHRRRMRDMNAGRGDFCLSPETRVLTTNLRWRPVGDLVIGDELVGFDEEIQTQSSDGSTRGQQRELCRSVVTAHDLVTLPSFEIQTDKTTPIVASENHLWLARGPKRTVIWKATKDLEPGDEIIRFGGPWEEAKDPVAAAYLAGLMDGEGHITKQGRLVFSQKPGAVLEAFEKAIQQLDFELTERYAGALTEKYQLAVQVDIAGSTADTMRFLYQVPTVRLRKNAGDFWVGRQISPKGRYLEVDKCLATVTSITSLGERPVVAIGTTTKTLIAEGLYSHNSPSNIAYKMLDQRGLLEHIAEISGRHIGARGVDTDSNMV